MFQTRFHHVAVGVFVPLLMGFASLPDNAAREHTGEYTLLSVNGKPLPFTENADSSSSASLISATLLLQADGGMVEQYSGIIALAGRTHVEDFQERGSYKVESDTIFITLSPSSGPLVGVKRGNLLRFESNGIALVYKKQ